MKHHTQKCFAQQARRHPESTDPFECACPERENAPAETPGFIQDRCPRCGSQLLSDGARVWCSFVGGRRLNSDVVEPACGYGHETAGAAASSPYTPGFCGPRHRVLIVLWEWTEGPHKGARFAGAHLIQSDGRIRDWPKIGLRALGAAVTPVVEGEGLGLIAMARAPERA
jgi:hypothetical protein